MNTNERWLPVKGWDGKYWISDHGRFKTFTRKYNKKYPNGYIAKTTIGDVGYRTATFRNGISYSKSIRIHVLVAEHFCNKPESLEKLCVNHIDGDKLNNHYLNLEWITFGDNIRHAISTGLMDTKGEKHKHAKLKEVDVIEMRRLHKMGTLTHGQIAMRFGICRRQAGDVINGVNWGWLKDGLIKT